MLYTIVPWEIVASLGDEPVCPWADLPTRLEELELIAEEGEEEAQQGRLGQSAVTAAIAREPIPSTDPADYLCNLPLHDQLAADGPFFSPWVCP